MSRVGQEAKHLKAQTKRDLQRIETIKHMPNHWHLEFFDTSNISTILGGFPTFAYGLLGAGFATIYYKNQAAHTAKHFYLNHVR